MKENCLSQALRFSKAIDILDPEKKREGYQFEELVSFLMLVHLHIPNLIDFDCVIFRKVSNLYHTIFIPLGSFVVILENFQSSYHVIVQLPEYLFNRPAVLIKLMNEDFSTAQEILHTLREKNYILKLQVRAVFEIQGGTPLWWFGKNPFGEFFSVINLNV